MAEERPGLMEILWSHPVTPADSADATCTSQGEEGGGEEAGVEESE